MRYHVPFNLSFMRLLNVVYNLATFLLSLVLIPYFLSRGRGRIRLFERFGFWGELPSPVIWVHGASAGEMRGLMPVIDRMKRETSCAILVTVTSSTGLSLAENMGDVVRIAPFDSSVWLFLALRRVRIQAYIGAETEIWPALYYFLSARGVPLVLVNARISNKTFPRYLIVRPFLATALSKLSAVYTIDRVSVERFIQLGVPEDRVTFLGNAKYDSLPALGTAIEISEQRRRFIRNNLPTIVLGSIRPGEEQVWFPALKRFEGRLNCFVVPRHSESYDHFARALGEHRLSFLRLSLVRDGEPPKADGEPLVLLVDTFGELERLYAIASLAFIGGTVENHGGHNPLEPAAYRVPPVVGPFVQNVSEVVCDLRAKGGVIDIETEEDVVRLLGRLFSEPGAISLIGEAAHEVWRGHRGAGERILQALKENRIV